MMRQITNLPRELVMHIFSFHSRITGAVLSQCVSSDGDTELKDARLSYLQMRESCIDSLIKDPRWGCLRAILEFEQHPDFDYDHGVVFLNFFSRILSQQFGRLSTQLFFSNGRKTEYYFYFRAKKVYIIAHTNHLYRIIDCIAQT